LYQKWLLIYINHFGSFDDQLAALINYLKKGGAKLRAYKELCGIHAHVCDRCQKEVKKSSSQSEEITSVNLTAATQKQLKKGYRLTGDFCPTCISELLGPWLKLQLPIKEAVKDPIKARELLTQAGILDKHGELSKPYRSQGEFNKKSSG
jgi:hypothetical protein